MLHKSKIPPLEDFQKVFKHCNNLEEFQSCFNMLQKEVAITSELKELIHNFLAVKDNPEKLTLAEHKLYAICYAKELEEEKLKRNTARNEAFEKRLALEASQRNNKTEEDLSKPMRDVKKELQQKYQKQADLYRIKQAAVLQRKAVTEQKAQIEKEEITRFSNIELYSNQQKLTRQEVLYRLFSHYNSLMSPKNKFLSPQEKQKAFSASYPDTTCVKSVWNALCYLTGSKAITEAHKEQIKNNEYGILETIWHFVAQILSLGYKSTTYGAKQEIHKFGDLVLQANANPKDLIKL